MNFSVGDMFIKKCYLLKAVGLLWSSGGAMALVILLLLGCGLDLILFLPLILILTGLIIYGIGELEDEVK